MRQQAALVEGSRDQPRHDGKPCAGEQQLHSVTDIAPEPNGLALEQKSTPGTGLKFRLSQNAVPSFGALQAARQSDTKPRSLDIERYSFNELPEKFKAVADTTHASRPMRRVLRRDFASAVHCPGLSAGRSRDTLAGDRRRSRGDRSRAAARSPFSPPGSAADFPSRPAAPSADQAAPVAAASDWRLPETASRARHRVARRGRVSRCTS